MEIGPVKQGFCLYIILMFVMFDHVAIILYLETDVDDRGVQY